MTPLPAPATALIRRLRAARRRITLASALRGALLLVATAAGLWALLAALESGLWLPPGWRLAAVVLLAACVIAGFVWGVLLPILRGTGVVPGLSDDMVARRIGRAVPSVRDRLLNLMQLLDGRHTQAPAELVSLASEQLQDELSPASFEAVEDFSGVRRAARWSVIPIAALLLFAVAAPSSFREASARLLAPATQFARPAPFGLAADPGNVELVKGSDLALSVLASGTLLPEGVELVYRFTGETVDEGVPLALDANGRASHTLVNLRQSLIYRFESAGVRSPEYRVTVIDRPVVGDLRVALVYPAYTRLPSESLAPNDGNIVAVPGTSARLESIVSGPELAQAGITFGSGRLEELAIEGRRVSGAFQIRRDDTWQLSATSEDGVTNADPVAYTIRVVEDAPPSVSLTSPEEATDLDEQLLVDLGWRMTDDFGFSRVTLNYRLSESRFGEPDSAFRDLRLELADPFALDQAQQRLWDLGSETDLDPVPGDVIEYFIEVFDNNGFRGPQAARSGVQRLRMPSLAELYEDLEAQEDDTQNDLEELLEEAQQVREQFDALSEELRTKPESDWQDQRELEQLQERQQELEQSVENISQQIEEITDQMERNDLVSEETLELFRELQEVSQEINSPELSEALQQLQEAVQEMNLQQMQDALENFEFSEEQYMQRLERTLDLFKNLRVQQDLDEVIRRAEALAEMQERIAEATEELQDNQEQPSGDDPGDSEAQDEGKKSEDAEALAEEQEAAAAEMQNLEEQMEELTQHMDEIRQAPSSEMQELLEQTQGQQMPEQMQQNADDLRQQDFQNAQQDQQQMSQQLRALQQKLQQMQQGMQGQQMQVNMAALRRALDDVLGLSKDQESLRAEVQQLAADSPVLRETAQQQLRLSEGLAIVSDSLQSLSRDVPQMTRQVQTHAGESLREMADATVAMTDRAARRSAGHQKGAMTHLNELALLLSDLLNQMMNGSGAGGSMSMQQMMQQLQQMAGQQQQLNQQIQQLLNDMQGNRLSSDMQERLRQLGQQQDQMRQQLSEMARDRSLQDQALGDLQKIAEQMAETIQELERRQLSRRTVDRQQEILTRLLEASRSLQERGRDRRRESETGAEVERASPAELDPAEQADQLRRDLIRALERGYAPDYETLIRRYFELLQQQAAPDVR